MSNDKNSNYAITPESPAVEGAAITPTNTTTQTFPFLSRAIYVGGAGNVAVVLKNDTVLTFNNVPAGTFLPIRAKRVAATGTTATNMLALW